MSKAVISQFGHVIAGNEVHAMHATRMYNQNVRSGLAQANMTCHARPGDSHLLLLAPSEQTSFDNTLSVQGTR